MSLYQAVEKIAQPFLEGWDIAKLPLQVGLLEMTYKEGEVFAPRELSFFDPLPEEALRGFPMAKGHDTTVRLDGYKDSFKLYQRELHDYAIRVADGFCISLAWHLNGATRDGITED